MFGGGWKNLVEASWKNLSETVEMSQKFGWFLAGWQILFEGGWKNSFEVGLLDLFERG